jgi:hypothetical protein
MTRIKQRNELLMKELQDVNKVLNEEREQSQVHEYSLSYSKCNIWS